MFTEKTKYRAAFKVTTTRRVFFTSSANRAARLAARYVNAAIWERVDRRWERIA